MKCQNLFSGKNKKIIINLSSTESGQRVVNVLLEDSGLLGVNDFKRQGRLNQTLYKKYLTVFLNCHLQQ